MRIIIADDHPLTLEGTKTYVEKLGHLVEEACLNGIKTYQLIEIKKPDIAILDINLPGIDGLEILQKIFFNKLKTKVIILTMHKEITLFNKAKEFNAYGYILKEQAHKELKNCLTIIEKGDKYFNEKLLEELIIDKDSETAFFSLLTRSEQKIIQLIAQQYTSKQIAAMLFLSEKTIEGYRTSIIRKLNLPKEKNALLKWAIQNIQ